MKQRIDSIPIGGFFQFRGGKKLCKKVDELTNTLSMPPYSVLFVREENGKIFRKRMFPTTMAIYYKDRNSF